MLCAIWYHLYSLKIVKNTHGGVLHVKLYTRYQTAQGTTCIELNFSENIAMKPKLKMQDAHFSCKQYTLHCTIVKPGE